MRNSSGERGTMSARGLRRLPKAWLLDCALPVWIAAALPGAGPAQMKTIPLSALDLSLMSSGWGKAVANRSIVGNELLLGSRKFVSGIGTHAESRWLIKLDGKAACILKSDRQASC